MEGKEGGRKEEKKEGIVSILLYWMYLKEKLFTLRGMEDIAMNFNTYVKSRYVELFERILGGDFGHIQFSAYAL